MFGLTPIGVVIATVGMLVAAAALLGIRMLLNGMTIQVLDESDRLIDAKAMLGEPSRAEP
jgi:hypothetical protein